MVYASTLTKLSLGNQRTERLKAIVTALMASEIPERLPGTGKDGEAWSLRADALQRDTGRRLVFCRSGLHGAR